MIDKLSATSPHIEAIIALLKSLDNREFTALMSKREGRQLAYIVFSTMDTSNGEGVSSLASRAFNRSYRSFEPGICFPELYPVEFSRYTETINALVNEEPRIVSTHEYFKSQTMDEFKTGLVSPARRSELYKVILHFIIVTGGKSICSVLKDHLNKDISMWGVADWERCMPEMWHGRTKDILLRPDGTIASFFFTPEDRVALLRSVLNKS